VSAGFHFTPKFLLSDRCRYVELNYHKSFWDSAGNTGAHFA